MHLKKSQKEILEIFRKDIFTRKTIREISLEIKKDYPGVYNSVKELSKDNIIDIKKIGKSNLCELNLNPKTISVLSFLDEQEAFSKNIPNINKILEFNEFLDEIIIVAGSYASEKQTKKSDIDLVIITKEKAFEKQKLLENLTSLMIPEIHAMVITQKDFIDMLHDKKPNFGKEIFKNRLLFRNASRYYQLIKEAVENGFRG